jgi:hypothetical protein
MWCLYPPSMPSLASTAPMNPAYCQTMRAAVTWRGSICFRLAASTSPTSPVRNAPRRFVTGSPDCAGLWLASHGLDLPPGRVLIGSWNEAWGHEAVARLDAVQASATPGLPSRFLTPLPPVVARPAAGPERDLRKGRFRPGRVRAVLHALPALSGSSVPSADQPAQLELPDTVWYRQNQ